MKIICNEPMKNRTTLRIGGSVRALVIPESEAELMEAVESAGERCFILGRGSNLLVADGELDFTAVSTEALCDIAIDGTTLTAGAGATLTGIAVAAAKAGLSGLEFAHGIPGSVGGGVFMNAGAYGGELRDVISSVRVLENGSFRDAAAPDCGFGYRHSAFQDSGAVIVSAAFELERGDTDEILAKMRDLGERRRAKQPLEYPSAGSTFKRPEGHFAARLIDECGLRGLALGGAQVSEKHAGFLINRGGATFEDFYGLMQRVSSEVFRKTGVELEPEVKIIR